jgi:hypothetical protein
MTGLLPVKLNLTEWYQEQEGYKRIMIATEAIKRLGYMSKEIVKTTAKIKEK